MLAAFDQHFKEHDDMYSITRDREFYQSKFSARGKSKTSLPAREKEGAEHSKCTDKQRRKNTMDNKNSRRFQFTSYFSDNVVESN